VCWEPISDAALRGAKLTRSIDQRRDILLDGFMYSLALRGAFLWDPFKGRDLAELLLDMENGSTERSGITGKAERWISDNHLNLQVTNYRF